MEPERVTVPTLHTEGERLRRDGVRIMHLAVDNELAGILTVTDPHQSEHSRAYSHLA